MVMVRFQTIIDGDGALFKLSLMVMVRFQTIIDGDGALSNYH